MKLIGFLLINILAYVAGEIPVKLGVENANSAQNKWIVIQNRNTQIDKVDIRQTVSGDEWTLYYEIESDEDDIDSGEASFCNPSSGQQADVVDLAKKTLGLDGQDCPIMEQTIDSTPPLVQGNLEIDNPKNGQKIYVHLTLKNNGRAVVEITLYGRIRAQ